MVRVTFLVCLYGALHFTDAAGSFQWSKSYTLKATLTVPAANITEPYQVWLDGETGHSRVDFYHGMDKLYREWSSKEETYKYFKIHPETTTKYTNKEICSEVSANVPEIKMYLRNTYLPVKKWTYVEAESINGMNARKFVYSFPIKTAEKTANVTYLIWVTYKNRSTVAVPVRYVFEIKTDGKIIDHFRHDYSYFEEIKPAPSDVMKPVGMNCQKITEDSFYAPIDPLEEYIDPFVENSRVAKVFDRFKTKHNKKYINEEEHIKRMNIFRDNLRYINSYNRQHGSNSVGVNHLADLSLNELHNLMGTIIAPKDQDEGSGDNDDDEDEDMTASGGEQANFDWRDYGAVTSVKEQTPFCGACYAFTVAAAMESSAYVARGCKYGVDELSEQCLVDCSWGGNFGCNGGQLDYSLEWVKSHGLPMKKEYGDYIAMEGLCHIKNMTMKIKINNYDQIQKKKQIIKKHLRTYGPLLAAINSEPLSFIFHTGSSIYKDESCSSDKPTHGVVIVGYGRQDGEDYWIIKNSFGSDWGEGGYIKIATKDNICGVKNYVYYVSFKKNFSELCRSKV